MTGRHQIHRGTREKPGDFQPVFDWGAPVTEALDNSEALEMLRAACVRHIEAGGLIAGEFFGVEMVNCKRKDGTSPLTGKYMASNYCDPFAALLDGTPYGAGILPDVARLLDVDEYWTVGFLHGLDKTHSVFIGRRKDTFDESDSYKSGLSAGRLIGDEFARIQCGWEG